MNEMPMLDPSDMDVNAGFLCFSMHWRPNPDHPDPDMPGQKLSMFSYIPVPLENTCLCGSGKTYRTCCQPKRYWDPVCPNPHLDGYSLVVPQSAQFHPVDGSALRNQLMDDARLFCVADDQESGFWIFSGDPPVEDKYGILCLGDVELKQNHTLLISAMSDLRMQMLLKVIKEIAGDCLGVPEIAHDRVEAMEKRRERTVLLRAKSESRRKRRKK